MLRKKRFKVDPVVGAKLNSKSKEKIPVIIKFKNGVNNNNKVFNLSDSIRHNLPLVRGVACDMNISSIAKLSNDPEIEYISFDSKVFAQLDIASKSIACNFAHDEGYTGEDITVAVIDTGVSPHTDLVKPSNKIVGFKDFVNNKTKPYDDNGHGTHVSGIIASSGYSSNGKYAGIAPKANILGVKALDDSGGGKTSDIISAIQWVIDTKDVYDTKIVNLSLGSPSTSSYKSDPLAQAVEEAAKSGLTVVVAAGNSGPSKKTILSPGNSPSAITVGAVDDNKTPELSDDTIAPFSSRGPTNDGIKKPDVVAPGVDIMSLSNKKSNSYVSLSGTSMATPVVSGACALLFQKHGDMTPNQTKYMLKNSCIDLKEKKDNQGFGIINLKNLFKSSVPNEPNMPKNELALGGLFGDNLIILAILFLLFNNKI